METEAWIGKVVRATLTDGRMVAGVLACMDGSQNLVLHDGVEVHPPVADGCSPAASFGTSSTRQTHVVERIKEERFIRVGNVMVPGEHLIRFEVTDMQ